ncbi:T-complex protein 11-like protein 1 isoform X6 [Diceros bicornis minor]|uniref:T-complex protein 11-like protein 1 isoform X6 n=1 Tax=Diceros bicornis minor TaxID=77932 RepID=UPI0026EC2980|nr:T-complex protein 11-like protein 1 isoform X6 [Diceros bicornis minor]
MSENLDKSNINEAGKSKSNDSEQGLEDTVEGSEEALQKKIKSGSPSTQRVQRPHSSPPRFVTVEELLETAKGVTNMALAHEIVVNGNFRIKPVELPEDSLEKRVKDIVHKAFWDCLSVQLSEDPPAYDHAIRLLGEIKETLLSFLLPGHTRLRNQIREVLDLDLIKQEAEHGALDISKLAEFIIGMMGTLCAPARDEEVKKLKDIKEIVPLFRAIFSVLDLMKVDMANFAVSSIRPHLMQQSVEYERKKFQELLEKQPTLSSTDSLDFVTQWLEEATDDLMNQKHKHALPAGGGAAGSGDAPRPDPVAVQDYAYLKLLKWDHLRRPFPELLPSGGCPEWRWGESLPRGEQPPCPVWVQPPHHGQGDRAQGPDPGRGQSRRPHPQDHGCPSPDLLRVLPCLRSPEATAHGTRGIGLG